MFPGPSGECRPCKKNSYCPRGNDALVSTSKACPANMVTLRTGARSLNDCLNAPGFFYQRKSATVVRSLPCPANQFSRGLDKAPSCTACPTNWVTDPDAPAGTARSAAACVAPPGYFVSGETVVACPKGEFQDEYGMITSCKSCVDEVGEGVTTPTVGSTSAADCKWPEQGYMLLDSGGKAVFTATGVAVTPSKVTGARPCPQGYFCLGGNPSVAANISLDNGGYTLTNKAAGIPQLCPMSLTTADEGSFSVEQCVAPPGKYGDLATTVADCPSGTYKEAYGRGRTPADACTPCGTGLWLSEKNFRISFTDLYGQLLLQQLVRGSSKSCFIQQGMGTERTLTTNALRAVVCPANTYGVAGADVSLKKFGLDHSPCTACPANMITGYPTVATVQATGISYHVTTGTGLNTTSLFAITAEPSATFSTVAGTSSATGSGTGYYDVKACVNRPGFGYYNGASQKCPQGFFNAAGTDTPCSQCPPGTTTSGTGTDQDAAEDCRMLVAGYTLNGLSDKSPVLCPVGTYSTGGTVIADIVRQVQLDNICQACPANTWSLEPGAFSTAACSLCAPGFGKATAADTCTPCGSGTYGSAARSTIGCEACLEATRKFTYAWPSDNVDTYSPAVTSPPYAKGLEDCLADFSQIVNGAFYLDLVDTASVYEPTADITNGGAILNLQTCVAACATLSTCAAATFDYFIAQEGQLDVNGIVVPNNASCKLWTPATGSDINLGGIALKSMPAYNLALSKDAAAKDMGSGYYTQYLGANAAAALNTASLETVSAKSTIQECYDACTADNECAGVVFKNATAIAIECQLIRAVIQPGDSKRTLVKAVATSMVQQNCTAGQRRNSSGTGCETCPAGQYWDETFNFGFSCKVCNSPNVVSTDSTKCQATATSCAAGTEFNPAKPDECQPCRANTYKSIGDSGGIARKCENCSYTVSTDKTKCQKPAACSRGFEWELNNPGHCVPCEQPNYFKDVSDADESSVTKCQLCPTVGAGKFQNTIGYNTSYITENCLNNCDGGYQYDNTNTASRKDPTKCQKCAWPLVKAGPAPTQCMGVCDVRNANEALRTTPNSDRTKCITPVVCGRNEEFDKEFPEDVMKCKPCPGGYQNDNGTWLCYQPNNATDVTGCVLGTEVDPNRRLACLTCPLPLYSAATAGSCPDTCGNGGFTDTASASTLVADIGLNKDQFTYYYNGLYCMKQCGVDQFWNTAGSACANCTGRGTINGTARPHGQTTLDSCNTCTNNMVSFMGYCVTPIVCPRNTEYDIVNPLDVEKCTPCASGTNDDGIGRCA
eukprot:gene9696-9855_t